MTAADRKKYNCPNCGEPIGYTERCPYCLTVLNWRPTLIEFVPASFDEHKIEARVEIDEIYTSERNIQAKKNMAIVEERLATQLAKDLPLFWDLREEHDPFRQKMIYSAVLRLRKRR